MNRALIDRTIEKLESSNNDDVSIGLKGYNTISDRADGKPKQVVETIDISKSPLDLTPETRAQFAAAAAQMCKRLGLPLSKELIEMLEVEDGDHTDGKK
jgi:hypothetical protein